MNTLKMTAAFLVLAGLFGFMGWLFGVDLKEDFVHRGDIFEVVRDAEIVEARCKTKLFVFSFCDVKAKGAGVAGGVREFNYFVFGGLGEERVTLKRAQGVGPGTSRFLTTSVGMDYLTTRIVSYAVMMGVFSWMLIVGLMSSRRSR